MTYAWSSSYGEWEASFDGFSDPHRVTICDPDGAEHPLPAAVAWAFADELAAAAKAGPVSLTPPWPGAEPMDVEQQVGRLLADDLHRMARAAGAEQLETPDERAARLRTKRAQDTLGPYVPPGMDLPEYERARRHPVSAVIDVLDDVWQFFEEMQPPPGMTAKALRSALQAGMRAGYITSSRDSVYRKTRYATTAEGDAWMRDTDDIEQFVTTPGAEADPDREALREQRLDRERRLAADDALRANR